MAEVQDSIQDAEGGAIKAPFPAFGGKARVADLVVGRLDGDAPARNWVEPFAFTAAVTLRRPRGTIETINDRNAFVSNFWRAVQADPKAVARFADWPVHECDLHARHRWLVASDQAHAMLARVREDPEFFDPKIAGWWCWGACCWIGSGWCDETHRNSGGEQRPALATDGGGNGVNRIWDGKAKRLECGVDGGGRGVVRQLPDLSGDGGAVGRGVVASGKRARLAAYDQAGVGICGDGPTHKRAKLTGNGVGCGVHANGPDDTHRPQLADEFGRGRGVHGNMDATRCADRRAWITEWMLRLADRLRSVRVCCGHWDRVCDSPSTMTRLGTTAVFLDPPYRTSLACGTKNRTRHIYANDRHQDVNALCDEVQAWCLRWGRDRQVRIALCGLEGEYPELDKLVGAGGWDRIAWKSNGGYGNSAGGGENVNAKRERIWFSPHCVPVGGRLGLFSEVNDG